MKLKELYKTSFLAKRGKLIAIAVIVLLILGQLIPDTNFQVDKQIYTLKGHSTKHFDNPEAPLFFNSIKNNNGILCLGTSESTSLNGRNYYNYWNADSNITDKMSILSGAGRTCGVYNVLFQKYQNEVRHLKVLYFINPVYWRKGLNKVKPKYWDRYCSYGAFQDVQHWDETKTVESYVNHCNPLKKLSLIVEHRIRSLRRKFFFDLNADSSTYSRQFSYVKSKVVDTTFQRDHFDTTKNILKTFSNYGWHKPINASSEYRFTELREFIEVSKKMNVNLLCVVGPYNHKFIKEYSPGDEEGYQKISSQIIEQLKKSNVQYLDCSDLSQMNGTFNDNQHHSEYGAFLIFKRIKKWYEKNNATTN
ncbi:MAG: hypothetical protein MRY83_03745 [Flavobacteriales bacterium]|nr:hypothetical protein [Flavobacteriales bacterium]